MKNTGKAAFRLSLLLILFSTAPLGAQEGRVTAEVVPGEFRTGETIQVRVTYSIPEGQYQNLQKEYLNFEIAPAAGLTLGPLVYPPGEDKGDRIVYHGDLFLTAPLTIGNEVPAGEYILTITARYQFCDEDGVCFIPREEEVSVPLTILAGGAGGGGARIWQLLLMALLGGLLLNVMPCVLPVLSLKALSLVNQSGGDRKELRLGGLLYTAGVILSLLILGGVVIALKLTGEQIGWGFQFQNPAFILTLVVLVFVFALSLFEVFVITLPGGQTAAKLSSKGGHLGSFFSGIFAVLLATPCTAPFLGTALGFAFSQSPPVILFIFFLVGFGLALPFLLLGFFPKLIKALPKPGPWMNRFREIMAFLLLGTAVWLLSVLRRQIGGENLMGVVIFLFSLAFAARLFGWLGHPAKKRRVRTAGLLLALAVAFGGGALFINLDAPAVEGEETAKIPAGWDPFSPRGVDEAVASGDPVFLAFGAAWCLTCKTNETAVLLTDWAEKLFESGGVRRFYGDYTTSDPVIGGWISDFGRAGVPVYVYYPPGTGKAQVLPEVLTRSILESALVR